MNANTRPASREPELESTEVLGGFAPGQHSAYLSSSRMPFMPYAKYPGLWTKRVALDPSNGFRAEFQRLEPGTVIQLHEHPDEFEWLYVLSGDFIDAHHHLQSGDFVYRRPSVQHQATTRYGCDLLIGLNRAGSIAAPSAEDRELLQVHALTNPAAGMSVSVQAGPWQASAQGAEGVSQRTLVQDAEFGQRATLYRLAPGATMRTGRTAEDEFEQLVVLSGDLRDEQHALRPLDLVYRRPQPGPGPLLSTELGAEIFNVVYRNRGASGA